MLPESANELIKTGEAKMQDALSFLEEELKNFRVGKANPAIFNNVCVDYYGTMTPLSQVSSITAPDAKTLMLQPWEKAMIAKIEKAIIDANLGFTPQNNGEAVRCNIPPLTEDRRKDLIKKAKATGESSKIVVRNARRDVLDQLKKMQKANELTEDALKEGEDLMQKHTDKFVKQIDDLISAKEKDIMVV